MRFLLNVIWLVFSGIWMAIGYALAGIVAFVFVVTIPFGIASFRMANYALWPFGRTVLRRSDAGAASALGNVLWLVFSAGGLPLGTWSPGSSFASPSSVSRWVWPTSR